MIYDSLCDIPWYIFQDFYIFSFIWFGFLDTSHKEHFNSSVRLKGALKNAWLFEHRRIKYSLEARAIIISLLAIDYS